MSSKTSQRPQCKVWGTSLFTGAYTSNHVRNSQTSRFVSVLGQNPEGHAKKTAWSYSCNRWRW